MFTKKKKKKMVSSKYLRDVNGDHIESHIVQVCEYIKTINSIANLTPRICIKCINVYNYFFQSYQRRSRIYHGTSPLTHTLNFKVLEKASNICDTLSVSTQ